jgi:hypothetical protein
MFALLSQRFSAARWYHQTLARGRLHLVPRNNATDEYLGPSRERPG